MKQVGLSIRNTAESSYPDLAHIARSTGTLASVPVDCDGDGDSDLASGAPLVCQLRPTGSQDGLNLVPAVVGLLNSVQDKVDVGLEVKRGDDVVENLQPAIYPNVLLQTAKQLTYDVEFHCSRSQAGERFKVNFAAQSSVALPLAVAGATVICKKLPEDKKRPDPVPPILPPLIPTVGAIAAAPPPPPPPAVSNLSSASQAQSQAQAQGATATQEQEEPQLALAQAYFEAMDEAEYEFDFAMTAYHGEKNYPPAGAMFGMGAVAISLMASGLVVMRRRNKYSVSPAKRQRRY
jgi:hypothetical protein